MIFDEYRRFAAPKVRPLDQQFIELYDEREVVLLGRIYKWLPIRWDRSSNLSQSSTLSGSGHGGREHRTSGMSMQTSSANLHSHHLPHKSQQQLQKSVNANDYRSHHPESGNRSRQTSEEHSNGSTSSSSLVHKEIRLPTVSLLPFA